MGVASEATAPGRHGRLATTIVAYLLVAMVVLDLTVAVSRIVAGRIDDLDVDTPAATAEIGSQARDAFASGRSIILLIAGIVAFASCVAALLVPAKEAAPPATD